MILEDTLSDVTIIVKDTGTGVKEEDRAKMFEPFYTTKAWDMEQDWVWQQLMA